MPTLRRRIAFSAIPLVLLLVAAEGGLRAWPKVQRWVRQATFTLDPDAANYIVTMGDSVTTGIDGSTGWPSELGALLRENGDNRTSVVNIANRGQRLVDLRRTQLTYLERVPRDARLTVTLLACFNDFQAWPGMQEVLTHFGESASPEEPRRGPNLRLLNVVLWRLGTRRTSADPSPEAATWIAWELAQIRDAVRARGGTFYVLTYAFPGPLQDPGQEFSRVLEASNARTLAIDQILREVSRDLSLPLIDLQYDLLVSPTWDPTFCQNQPCPQRREEIEVKEVRTARSWTPVDHSVPKPPPAPKTRANPVGERARRWQRLMDEGLYPHMAALARAEGVSPAAVIKALLRLKEATAVVEDCAAK